jgi:hypothetical protein
MRLFRFFARTHVFLVKHMESVANFGLFIAFTKYCNVNCTVIVESIEKKDQ